MHPAPTSPRHRYMARLTGSPRCSGQDNGSCSYPERQRTPSHECGKGQQRQSLTRAGRSATLTGEIIVGFTLGQILAEPYLASLSRPASVSRNAVVASVMSSQSSSSTSFLFRRSAPGFRLPKSLARVFACAAAMAACTLDTRAANQFDGAWDFVLITKSGPCNPSYSVKGRIIDGALQHSGVLGRVAPSGAVSATVSLGPIHASGSGRFSGASGNGIWRGEGLGGPCSGTWFGRRK
jgi:hypothetical protein